MHILQTAPLNEYKRKSGKEHTGLPSLSRFIKAGPFTQLPSLPHPNVHISDPNPELMLALNMDILRGVILE